MANIRTERRRSRSPRACSWIVALALLSASCGGAPPAAPATAPRVVRYTFEVDPDRARVDATVCFEGGQPSGLAAIHEEGRARIQRAQWIVGGEARELPHEHHVDLRGLPEGGCVRYRADVSPGSRRPGSTGSSRVGDDLVATTGLWLWAPEPRDATTEIRARFVMPEGMRASRVWGDAEPGWLALDERAFRYLAYVAFGRFEVERVAVPGGCIEAAVLGSFEADAAARARWLGAAGRSVSHVLGRFPAERAGVILMPVALADTPVLFGIVGRGVLPTVALLVGERATSDALVADWTAVHEFTHLASPYVEREESWLTEGLATYYQQVLRAREGLITPEQAWSEMVLGLARGESEGTGRALGLECRDMSSTFAYGRVYWAGAALALLADVEYRRASGGAESLDDAMLRAGPLRDGTLRAAELVRAMDGVEDGPFARVVARWLESAEFPDVDPALTWLGVQRTGGGAELVAGAEGAAVREAIMNDPGALASNPADCE